MKRDDSMKANKAAVLPGKNAKTQLLEATAVQNALTGAQAAAQVQSMLGQKAAKKKPGTTEALVGPDEPQDLFAATDPQNAADTLVAAASPYDPRTALDQTLVADAGKQATESSVSSPASSGGGSPTWAQTLQSQLQHIDPLVVQQVLAGFAGLVVLGSMGGSGSSGVGAGGPTPGGGSSSGAGLDGYLSNALVWRDANGNGQWDQGEAYAFTDGTGKYTNLASGPGVISMRGLGSLSANQLTALGKTGGVTTDISTGLEFKGLLTAAASSSVVTPLTTLAVATGGDAAKLAVLKASLGIPENLDLSAFDPLAALTNPNADSTLLVTALKSQTSAIQVSNLLAMASSTLGATGINVDLSAVVSSVSGALVTAAAGGGGFLSSTSVLTAALNAAVSSQTIPADKLASLNAAIDASAAAMASVNNAMNTSLNAAIASGVTLQAALGALTNAVATQLVVLNQLVSTVASAVASNTVLSADTLASQYSADALASRIEQAKSLVQTIVVVEPGQTILVAADDFASAAFGASDWSVQSGNLLGNDLSGGVTKTVTAAAAGATTPGGFASSLTGKYGVLSLSADGSYSYAVNKEAVASDAQGKTAALLLQDVFTYTVSAGGKTSTAKLTVTIPTNPVKLTDSDASANTISEAAAPGDAVAGLLLQATDLDTSNITLSLTDSAEGLFALSGNRLVLAANKSLNFDAASSHKVTVRASSADGTSTTQDFTITVAPDTNNNTNTAPVLSAPLMDQTVTAGQTLSYAFASGSFTDADNDSLTYTAKWVSGNNLLDLPSWLQFNADTRTFSAQTSAANGLGSITVRVSASDGINPAVSDEFSITVNPVVNGTNGTKGMFSSQIAQLTVYQDSSDDGKVNYETAVPATLTGSYSGGVLNFANTAIALPSGSLLALTDGDAATQSLTPSLSLPLANVPTLNTPQPGKLRVSFTRGTDAIRTEGQDSQVSVDLDVQYINDNAGALVIRAADNQKASIRVINSSGSIDLSLSQDFGATDILANTISFNGNAQLNLNVLSLLTKLDGTYFGQLIGNVLRDGNYTLSFTDLTGNMPFTNAVGSAVSEIDVGLPISSGPLTNHPPSLVFGSDLATDQLHAATSPVGGFALGNFLLSGGGADTGGGSRFDVVDPENNFAWIWVFKPQYGSLKLLSGSTLSDVSYTQLGQEQFVRLPSSDLVQLVYVPPQGDYNSLQTVNLRFILEDTQNALSTINSFRLDLDPNLYSNLGFVLSGEVNPDDGVGLAANARVLSLPTAGDVYYKAPNSDAYVKVSALDTFIPKGSLLKFVAPDSLNADSAGQLRLALFDNDKDLFSFKLINFYKSENPNHPPVLGDDVTVDFAENSTSAVGTFAATDADVNNTLSYSLDPSSAQIFSIDASGVLRFKQAPDYEALSNKTFSVLITASDGQASDTQTVTVNVTNVNEGITDLTLSNPVHLQENVSTAVQVGTLHVVTDTASTAGSITYELLGADKDRFALDGNKLVFKAGQQVDYETRSSYSLTVRVTDSSINPPSVIERDFDIPVDNAPDTLALSRDEITVRDYDAQGNAIDILVPGNVSQQNGKNLLNFSMGSPFNRDNLLQLFDGDWETGFAPSLSFKLADTSLVTDGRYTLQAALDVSNTRLGAMKVGMSFDVDVALTHINNQLQMQLPAQTVQLHLTAGGVDVLTLPLNNLDNDAFSLVTGDNITPELEFKIDNLLYKASDNLISLSELNDNALISLGAGAVMGLLSGKTLGDLLSLSKDVINLPPDLQDTRLSRLIELLQDTISLPASLQNLSFEKVLGYAANVMDLPSSITLGTVLTTLRNAVELPPSLRGNLANLKDDLTSALDQQTVQSLETLARAMLGSNGNPYQGDLGGKTIPQVLDMLANSELAHTHLSQMGNLSESVLGGYSLAQIFNLSSRLVDGLYGDKTLGDLVKATQNAITLTPELADLSSTSLVGLVKLAGLAITGQDLLGGHLSATGLLDVVRDAITIDGVISQSRLGHILELLDATFDLTPILGTAFPVSSLITQLKDGQIDLEAFINLTSSVLLSADGEVDLTLGVRDLGLTSAQGSTMDAVHLHALLDNTSNTAGNLSLPALLTPSGSTVDLGALISNALYHDPQGDSLRGVIIAQPQAGMLKIGDVTVSGDSVFVTQAQLAQHQVSVQVPDRLEVELALRAVDVHGAVAMDQWLVLQQNALPVLM